MAAETTKSKSGSNLVENSHLFQAFGTEGFRLLETGKLVSYSPGTVIIKEGEKGDTFYMIQLGEVEVTTNTNGQEVKLATLSSGDIFGEVTLFSNKPRTATVTAKDRVHALEFQNKDVLELISEHPKAREILQQIVLHRAESTIDKLVGKP